MRLAALLAVVVSLTGCFYLAKEERVRSIEIRTIPYGAAIATRDDDGQLAPRGEAPVVVQARYTVSVRRFKHLAWIWPGLSVAGTAAGLAIGQSAESRKGGGDVLAAFSVIGVLVTGIMCIVGEMESGKLKSTSPAALIVVTRLPGGPEREHELSLRDADPRTTLSALQPGSRPSPEGTPSRPPLPRDTRIAVFELNDLTGQLSEGDRHRLDQQLAQRLFAEGLGVVTGDRIRPWLARRGIDRCYPGTCQATATRALLANRALATKLRRVDGGCAITAELYDTWSSHPGRTTSTRTDCTVAALMDGMEKIADQLAAGD